ncbi:MAG: hypothetical protein IJH39_04125 [Clostridia bacterium]|nr:hypothetical protein [Clostridia bacterium]
MTKEIYEELKEYEQPLGNAYKANYVRMLNNSVAGNLARIYEELYNQKSRILNGCGHCVLTDLKRMGKDFFEFQEALEKATQTVNELNEVMSQVEVEPEPKDVTSSKSEDKPKRRNNKVTNKSK